MAKRRVKMRTSLQGGDVSLDAGKEYELEEGLALALVTDPAEDPRAEPLGWEPPAEAVEAARERADQLAEADAEQQIARRGEGAGEGTLTTESFGGEQNEEAAASSREDLLALKRGELNARAGELGIEGPEQLPNKEAVVDAILAVVSDETEAAAKS